MMKKKNNHSFKTRIIVINIVLVLVAFLVMISSFNLVVNYYINQTVSAQLSGVLNYQSSHAPKEATSSENITSPDLGNAPRGLFNTHPYSVTLKSDYTLISTPEDTSQVDNEIAKEVVAAVRRNKISLAGLNNYKLETDNRTFYLAASPLANNNYNLFYVDISGITRFANSVSLFLMVTALIIIVLLSIALAFITRHITSPLSKLANFAVRIGKGNFEPLKEDYRGSEFAILADNMNTAARQLDNNDKDQKLFFQNASHELRTPLMSIKSYAEGISYDVMPAKEASKVIISETDRMSELVEDLLTLSRLDSLNSQQEFAPIKLQELLKDVIEEQTNIAQQRKIQMITTFDKKELIMNGNYKALRRAVSNIVSNALRYAKSEIIFSCKKENGHYLISISNDGEKIKEEAIPHLFERFYKGKGGVHGIGLAIVKSVVEQHHGEISVKSDEKKTSFMMTFRNRT